MGYALWDSDLERLVPFRFAAVGLGDICGINQQSGDSRIGLRLPRINDGDCSLGSLLTRRWRGVDSNFQYAEAVKLGCRRFFLRRLLDGSAWCSPNSITEKILPGTLALVGVGKEPKRGALVVIAAGNAEVWRPLVPDAASARESYGLYGAPPPVVPIG